MDDEATDVECCSKNPEDLENQNKYQNIQIRPSENGIQDNKEKDFQNDLKEELQDKQEDIQVDEKVHSEDDEEESNEDRECEKPLVRNVFSDEIFAEEPLPPKPRALCLTKSKVRFADDVLFESSVNESSEPEESYFGEVEEGYSEFRSSEDDVRRRREYTEPVDQSDDGRYYSRDADSITSEYSETQPQIDQDETSDDESALQDKFTVTTSVQTEEDIGIRKASSVYDNFIYYATKLAKSAAQLSPSSQAGPKCQANGTIQSAEGAESEQSAEEEPTPNKSPETTVIRDVNNNTENTKYYYNLQDLAKVTTPVENLSETVPENVHDISFHYVPKNGSFYNLEPSGFSINFNFSPSQAALKSNSESQPILKSKNSVSSYFPTPSTATCASKMSTPMGDKETFDSKAASLQGPTSFESGSKNKTTAKRLVTEKKSKFEVSSGSPSPAGSLESECYKANGEARRSSGADADTDECSSVETIKLPSEAVKQMEKSHSNLSMLPGINSQATLESLTASQTAMVSQRRYSRHSRTDSNRRSRTISRQKSFSALKVSSKTNNHISEYTHRHRQYKPVYDKSVNSVSVESFKFSGYVKHSASGVNRSKKMLPKKLRDAQFSRRKVSPTDAAAFECIVPKNACSSKSESSRLWTNVRITSAEAAGGVAVVSDSEKRFHHSSSAMVLRQSSSTSSISPQTQNMQNPTRSKNYIRENIAKVSSRPIGLEDALRMPYSERPPLSGTSGLRNNTTSPNQTKGSRAIPALPLKLKTRNLLLTRPANVGVLSPTAPIPEERPSSGIPPAPPTVEVGKAKKTKTSGKKTAVLASRTNTDNTIQGAKADRAPLTPVTEPTETVKKPLKKVAAKSFPDSNASLASSPYAPGNATAGASKSSLKSSRASATSVKRSKAGSSTKTLNRESAPSTSSIKSIRDYVAESSKSSKVSVSKLSKKRKVTAESKDPYYVEATPSDKVMINELVRADLEKILERDALALVADETPDDREPLTKPDEVKKELESITSPHAIKSAPLPRRGKVGQAHAKRPGTAASGTNSRDEEHKADIVLKGLKKPAKKSKAAPTKSK